MKTKKILMVVLAVVVMASMGLVFAANVPAEVKTNAEIVINKKVTASDGLLPDVTEFKFNLEKVRYTLAKDGIEVTSDLSYMPEGGELTIPVTPNGENTEKNGSRTYSLDFSDKEVGVYRYKLTEQNGGVEGVEYDDKTYYIDVYVINQIDEETGVPTGKVTVSDIVVWEKTEDSETKKTRSDAANTPNQVEYPFISKYETSADLSVAKIVKGNYANLNQAFEFEVTLDNLADGETYTIEYYQNGVLVEGTINDNPTTVKKEDGKITLKLKNGEKFVVKGLPANAEYTVVENQEATYTGEYKAYGEEATGEKTGKADMGEDVTVKGTLFDNKVENGVLSNEEVTYTNTKEYTAPTGIIVSVLPFVVGVVLVGALFVIVSNKRSQEE